MKKLVLLLGLISTSLSGQTDEDLQNFGRYVFLQVTDSVPQNYVRFIQMMEYHQLIQTQPVTPNQKSVMKHRINETYDQLYKDWEGSMRVLREDYDIEREDGATFEYMTSRKELMEGAHNVYSMQTTFMYRNGKVQTRVSFNYDAAWLEEFQTFVMISEVSEDF